LCEPCWLRIDVERRSMNFKFKRHIATNIFHNEHVPVIDASRITYESYMRTCFTLWYLVRMWTSRSIKFDAKFYRSLRWVFDTSIEIPDTNNIVE
jgi:hypothetical protein